MEETRAWELLNDPQHAGGLNAEGILELCKAAGYSEEASQQAAKERALARLRNDLPA